MGRKPEPAKKRKRKMHQHDRKQMKFDDLQSSLREQGEALEATRKDADDKRAEMQMAQLERLEQCRIDAEDRRAREQQ